jgi:predicted nucleotidyltransferase
MKKQQLFTNASVNAILSQLQQYLKKLYAQRLIDVVLFGSYARGDGVPGSDIDVMIVLQAPVNPGTEIARVSDFTANLSLQHNIVISCTFVSAERFRSERSPLLLNIRREGIRI